jgi:hypothetical protein
MAKEAGKKLSTARRIGGFALIGLCMAGGLAVGYMATGGWGGSQEASEPMERTASAIASLLAVLFVTGVFFLGAGVALYGLTLATRCFTSDFSRPFWNSFKKKLFVMNIIVVTSASLGVAGFVGMAISPILVGLGVSVTTSVTATLIGTYIVVQLVTIWLIIWTPLDKLTIDKRMAARGIPEDFIGRGIRIGISDPAKSSMKKMTVVEEDVGMMWLGNAVLVYRGDNEDISIRRDQLIAVERAADAGSTSALFGNVNVIVRFVSDERVERRLRLHSEGGWTMGSRARASDSLAEELIRWKDGPSGAVVSR